MKKEITFDRFIRSIVAIAIIALTYILLSKLSNVLTPFFIAWLIAYILYPIVCFFQYKCRLKSRALSITVTLLLIIGLLIGSLYLIIPPVTDEIVRLKDIIINYVNTKTEQGTLTYEIEQYIKNNINIEKLSKSMTFTDITAFLEERVPQLFNILSSSISAIIGVVCSLMAIIYLFFILNDYETMSNGLIRMIPKDNRPFVQGIFNDVKDGMNKYFRGQSLIAFLVGILFAIGFVIIDFPLAIPLGLFIGMLNLVPYLQGLGFIPTIILALLKAHDTGENFWAIIIAALAVFAIVQAIQDWVLVPRIMGKMTGLNAATILLALSVWGALLGFVGLIIALPLTTLIISYYKRFVLGESNPASLETTQQSQSSTQQL
jgi:predicted PurR-regulated permease PerM